MNARALLLFALLIAAWGCRVSPQIQRPVVPQPPVFRGATGGQSQADSIADRKWFELFRDPQLQELIRLAHAGNYDVREAVARIESAQAGLGVARADLRPSAGVNVDATSLRISRGGNFPLPQGFNQNRHFGTVAVNLLSYEADVWGRLRNASDAARAELLAAEENRRAVMMTLTADVAAAWFELLALDEELEIATRTLTTREQSLRIVRLREQRGLATRLEVREAEQLVYAASQILPRTQQLIEQTENRISLLSGGNPSDIRRTTKLASQHQPPEIPAGLPSALLERRPDIRAAEQTLVAADYRVASAKAAFFPRISLTGLLGSQSNTLGSLFAAPTGMWQFVPQISQPIFTGGRLRSNERLAEADKNIAVVRYQRTVQTAFREVSDALVAHRKTQELRGEQEALWKTLEDRKRLAYLRYTGGVDPLLSALDADRDLFEAELNLIRTRRDELIALVQVYRALGGGWQP